MSKLEKLIDKIFSGSNLTYSDAEKILEHLGFELIIRGSHHVFRKKGYQLNISLKIRKELLNYQVKLLKDILEDHGYEKK